MSILLTLSFLPAAMKRVDHFGFSGSGLFGLRTNSGVSGSANGGRVSMPESIKMAVPLASIRAVRPLR